MHNIRRLVSRQGLTVETLNPTYGWLTRGTVRFLPNPGDPNARLRWEVINADHEDVAEHVGDYLDAEQLLLDATTWADDTTPEPEEQP